MPSFASRPYRFMQRNGARLHALFITGTAQTAIQLLGFVSGLVVIRSLSTKEYAYYTIAYAALGSINVVADSGIGNAVMAQGGKVWQDRVALGSVVKTGMVLRFRLAWITTVLSLPLLVALLHRQGAPWPAGLLIALSVVPSFFFGFSFQLLEVVLRLHQDITALQRNQLLANIGRAVLLSAGVLLWPFAAVACTLTAIPQAWSNWRLRKLVAERADPDAPVDAGVRIHITRQMLRNLPGAIYYAISGQLTIWLVSTFGANSAVAAVGALGRIAVVFAIVNSVFSAIAVPRFARIPAQENARIWDRFWQSQGLLALICLFPLLALSLAPQAVLSVLGPHYSGYGYEAVLMAVSGAVGAINAAAFGLSAARGIVLPPLIGIPYSVIWQIVLIVLLPVGTVRGVIWLGLISGIGAWLSIVSYFAWMASGARGARG